MRALNVYFCVNGKIEKKKNSCMFGCYGVYVQYKHGGERKKKKGILGRKNVAHKSTEKSRLFISFPFCLNGIFATSTTL